MTHALLLSIKPRYARAILEGRKTIEVRRRFPVLASGTLVLLYASSPERAVVGSVRIKQVHVEQPDSVWARHASAIEIEPVALASYLEGAAQATLLEVEEPVTWARPVPLADIRSRSKLEPAQSFRYLSRGQVAILSARGE